MNRYPVRLSLFGWLSVAWLTLVIALLSVAATLSPEMSLRSTGALIVLLFLLSILARIGRRREMLRRDREALKRAAQAAPEAIL